MPIWAPWSGGYAATILASKPKTFWRFNDAGVLLRDSAGNANGSYTATGTSRNRWAPLASDPAPSTKFDGAAGAASAAVDLSATAVITIEFWLNWTTWAATDNLAAEYSVNYNSNEGFIVDPNDSGTGKVQFGIHMVTGNLFNASAIVRPSPGVWHHYACVMDRTAAAGVQVLPYLDGQLAGYTKSNSGAVTGNFGNYTLYFMSRATTSLWADGYLANFAIFPRALSPVEIQEHYQAATTAVRPRSYVVQIPATAALAGELDGISGQQGPLRLASAFQGGLSAISGFSAAPIFYYFPLVASVPTQSRFSALPTYYSRGPWTTWGLLGVQSAGLTSTLVSTSNFTASLSLTAAGFVAAGSVSGSSVLAGNLQGSETLNGVVGAASTAVASLVKAEALSSSIASTAALTAGSSVSAALAASKVSTSVFRATATLNVALGSSGTWGTAVWGTGVWGAAGVTGIAGSSPELSSFRATATLSVAISLSYSDLSSFSATATLSAALSLGAVKASVSSFNGSLSEAKSLMALSAGLSAATANLAEAATLTASSAALESLSGSLQVVSGLQVAGASASGVQLSASLSLVETLVAATVASSAVGASLGEAAALAASTIARSQLSANLQLLSGQQIAGFSTAQGSLSGSLAVAEALATGPVSLVSLSGTLVAGTSPALAGISGSASVAIASLSLSAQLSGSEAGSSSLTVSLQLLSGLQVAGSVTGLSGVNASLKLASALNGNVGSSCALSGTASGIFVQFQGGSVSLSLLSARADLNLALAGRAGALSTEGANLVNFSFFSGSTATFSSAKAGLSQIVVLLASSQSASAETATLRLTVGLQGLLLIASAVALGGVSTGLHYYVDDLEPLASFSSQRPTDGYEDREPATGVGTSVRGQ